MLRHGNCSPAVRRADWSLIVLLRAAPAANWNAKRRSDCGALLIAGQRGEAMPEVTIVGGGIAGLTSALRLLQRGFAVTLMEQDNFLGGMLRAAQCDDSECHVRHEHSYHMFTNWYLNTWDIVDELNLRRNFTPRSAFRFLKRGHTRTQQMVDPGWIGTFWPNLFSGVASPPDVFVFMYSLIDLLSTPIHRDDFLDLYSVNAFMRARPYATEAAAQLQQRVWETVWAIPSYDASARTYKTFLKYGNFDPVPQLWLLNKNKYDGLIKPIEDKLKSYGDKFKLELLARVTKLDVDAAGRVSGLHYEKLKQSPTFHDPPAVEPGDRHHDIKGDLIVAATPGGLSKLITDEVYIRDPGLGSVRYLSAQPMASVELHFKEGVWLPNVPNDVTVLVDAKYQMTFLDYGQVWESQKATFLYVTVSDFEALMPVTPELRDANGDIVLDLQQPKTAIDYILVQLKESVPFNIHDLDLHLTRIDTNSGSELFANDTGSWQYRPRATTRIANLFLAGTFCRNYADAATIEGAVASGLMAAEHVRKRAGVSSPIHVKHPGFYHEALFGWLKLMWAPYAMGAKAWSGLLDLMGANADPMRMWQALNGMQPNRERRHERR
jgi:hypothetical protein